MSAAQSNGTASLLLAQLVLRYGDSDFSVIQSHLDQHPLLQRPAAAASELETQYEALLRQHKLKREPVLGPEVPLSAPIRELCRILHAARIEELKAEIRQEEEAFARIVDEISSIQAGKCPDCEEIEPSRTAEAEIDVSGEIEGSEAADAQETSDREALEEKHTAEGVEVLEEKPEALLEPVLREKEVETHSAPVLSVKIQRKSRPEAVEALETSIDVSSEETRKDQRLVCEKEAKVVPEKRDNPSDGTKSGKKHGIKKNVRGASKKEQTETWSSDPQSNNVHKTGVSETASLKRFQSMIMPLWMSLSQHKHGAVFMGPVSNKDAPGYSNLIYFPTDMKSIRNKIRDGKIKTSKQFHREILLLFANAIMYNGEDSTIAQWAREGFAYSEEMIGIFMQTESMVDGTKESEETPKLKRKKVL
ncbi:uncharacterized protein T551_01784 [Pneumocystis jirovecii RU7]|uniref:Bromo domain-containing protein n=1 Tax=Pneumocystis jirovecii (strain RU7) TaxID=1408657 RepID=A0A0W4ZQ45_PNEJ7|nr:uncharacterized protein T551_01784 [Pneumocystis jirovecii RU7]KTW30501.1 hypothetical protein T551_01784 [Pneumocystis jirovecii RU7]